MSWRGQTDTRSKRLRAFEAMRERLVGQGLVAGAPGFPLTPAGEVHVAGLVEHLRGSEIDCDRFGPRVFWEIDLAAKAPLATAARWGNA